MFNGDHGNVKISLQSNTFRMNFICQFIVEILSKVFTRSKNLVYQFSLYIFAFRFKKINTQCLFSGPCSCLLLSAEFFFTFTLAHNIIDWLSKVTTVNSLAKNRQKRGQLKWLIFGLKQKIMWFQKLFKKVFVNNSTSWSLTRCLVGIKLLTWW